MKFLKLTMLILGVLALACPGISGAAESAPVFELAKDKAPKPPKAPKTPKGGQGMGKHSSDAPRGSMKKKMTPEDAAKGADWKATRDANRKEWLDHKKANQEEWKRLRDEGHENWKGEKDRLQGEWKQHRDENRAEWQKERDDWKNGVPPEQTSEGEPLVEEPAPEVVPEDGK